MELSALFQQLFIALGLGLLVGLQRESAASPLAGVRTFPLVTILGAVSALLAQAFGGWLLAAAFLALAALIFSAKLAEQKRKHPDLGITTEAALLLMFAVGAYLIVGQRPIAIAIGGGTAVLLHFKGELHGLVGRHRSQGALISLVILSVLPNRTYGPYAVINPRHVWYMVVLIGSAFARTGCAAQSGTRSHYFLRSDGLCAILESRRGTALWLDGGRDAGPRFTHAVLPRIRCPLGCRSGRHTPNVVCHGRAALEAYGYRVITACDGAAAVALYAQRQAEVQLLLTDLMMPMMDGVTLIRTLRQRHPALRVICCSGTAGAMENPELEQLGVHRILAKPLNADTLLRAVAQILNET